MAKEQTETILVPLSETERQHRALELAEVSEQVLTLEAERTEYLREKNGEIKKLKRRVRDLVEAVRTGQEKREAQLNFDEHPGNARGPAKKSARPSSTSMSTRATRDRR